MKTLLLLTVSSLVWASDNRPADDKAVRSAMEKFNEAARNGDGAALDKLLSPDIVYSHSSAKTETKAEAIAALVKGKTNFVMEPGWTVSLYGNTALVRAKAVANGMTNGQATKTPLSMLIVWVKNGSGWQMVGRHTTRLP